MPWRRCEETLAAAHEAAGRLPADQAHGLLTAAQTAFTEGLAIAAGVGSALLLASAVAVWLLLKPRPAPEIPAFVADTAITVGNVKACEYPYPAR